MKFVGIAFPQICFLALLLWSPVEAGDSLSYDIFPLQTHLHYQYNYHRTYMIQSMGELVPGEIEYDSGKVDYIVRDSASIGDTSIVWQIDRIAYVLQRSLNHSLDTQRIYIDTTRFILTESLSGNHRITIQVDNMLDGYYYPSGYSPWSGITIDRYSLTTTVSQSSAPSAYPKYLLQYQRGLGLIYRWGFIFGMTHHTTYDTTYVEQITAPVGVAQEVQVPSKLFLWQNYPNPFNPFTVIKYNIPHKAHVSVKVYDMLGRKIVTLVNDILPAGEHSVVFNSTRFSSGIYFYRIEFANSVITKKLILLK